MRRRPEPELMDDAAQAQAYAEADFSEPHNRFIELFQRTFPGLQVTGCVLDLGCGPGDITLRFARAFPHCTVHGLDGAAAMLAHGEAALNATGLTGRVKFIHGYLPDTALPPSRYDGIISNSLLHHLAEPRVLWAAIKHCGRRGAPIFVMDLLRPQNEAAAAALVTQYAATEPAILQRDFFNSLLAAYRPDEITAQLQAAGLELAVEVASDRHFIVHGSLD